MELRAAAHAQGQTFAAFCWNATAENQPLRRLGQAAEISDEVEAFIRSSEWIDLLKVWDSQLIMGDPSAIKTIAGHIGVTWEVDDPGGAEAMVRYEVAVSGDPMRAATAREWLLINNQGDVLGTRAVREWTTASNPPSIQALELRTIKGPECGSEGQHISP
jgi:predicted RecB family nuclease